MWWLCNKAMHEGNKLSDFCKLSISVSVQQQNVLILQLLQQYIEAVKMLCKNNQKWKRVTIMCIISVKKIDVVPLPPI